jgi:flagellar hook-associated protein 3 FlgL
MRVSSTQMIGRYQKQLNDSYEDQAKLMEQSDGSKLHRPSDDSVNYSKFLRYQNSDTENDQYQSNVKTGISWMKTADAAMVNMKDIMTTLNEKTIQAATDTNGTSDIQAIGKEVLAKVQELVSLGNTQQGDRYMFAGQRDLEQPFTISTAKKSRGLAKTLDDPQSSFFSKVADGSGNMTQMLQLTGSDGNTYYLSTLTGAVYTREFVDEGYKDVIANDRKTVDTEVIYDTNGNAVGIEGEDAVGFISGWAMPKTTPPSDPSVRVSTYFESNGVCRFNPDKKYDPAYDYATNEEIPPGPGTIDVTDADGNTNTVKLNFAAIEQYVVEYNGDDKKISMVKRNGTTDPTADTVNVTGQMLFGSDIFDNTRSGNQVNGSSSGAAALNDMLMVAAKMDAGDARWLSSDGITATDKAHYQVIEAETTAAARQNVYDSVSTMLDKQNETITEDISNCSDADVAKLAIDLMTMQTIYNMSLSVGSRILPQSLADYL